MTTRRMALQDRLPKGDFFELSPGHKRSIEQVGDTEQIKAVLIIKPFAPKPQLIFDKVCINTVAKRTFFIRNPDPVEIQVEVVNLPCADRNLHLEATSFCVPGKSEVPVTLTWTPTEAGCWYETLHFKNHKGNRGAVAVTLESLALKKPKGAKRPGFGKAAKRGPTKVASNKPKAAKVASKPQWKVPVPAYTEPSAPWTSFAPSTAMGFPSIEIPATPSRRETYFVTNNGGNKENRTAKPTNDVNPPKRDPFALVPVNNTLDFSEVSPPKQRRLRFMEQLDANFVCSPVVPQRFTDIVPPASTLFSDTNFSDLSFASRRCSTASKSSENRLKVNESIATKVSPRALQFSPVAENRLSSGTYVVSASNSLESPGRQISGQLSPSGHHLEWSMQVKTNQQKVQLTLLSPEANFEDSLELSPCNNQRAMITEVEQVRFEPNVSLPIIQEQPIRFESQPIRPESQPIGFNESVLEFNPIRFQPNESQPIMQEQSQEPMRFEPSVLDLDFQDPMRFEPSVLDLDSQDPMRFEPSVPQENASFPSYNEAPSGFQQNSLSFSQLEAVGDNVETVVEERQRQIADLAAFSFTISPPGTKCQQQSSSLPGVVTKLPSPPAMDVDATNMFSDTTGFLLISPPKPFALPVLDKQDFGKVPEQQVTVPAPDRTYTMKIPYQVPPQKLSLAPSSRTYMVEDDATNDPDVFLYNFALSDATAPGSKKDPFYLNPLLCEAILEKYETDFTKWLNSVLTPPEELGMGEDTGKVNAAELWNRSTRTGAAKTLAPTRETVTFRYLSVQSRYEQLRKAARTMFKETSMAKVLCCVTASVDAGKIKIRDDKALHVDQGLKHQVLALFLSFNPLWLRLGLETVFGVSIQVQSNSDVPGLAHFIVHRLFSPEAVVHKSHLLLKKEFQTKFNRVVIKKFLLLVYFLDHAKTSKLIRHDPCLFRRNSEIKSSKELLVTFSRLLLAGEGDITRHLGYMGYKVFHKQGFLDEFRYSVEHLGVDLRDGVRLVRVVELLTGKSSLSCKLRVPPVSRLQKIHNVELALQGLQQEGYEVQNLKAADIVAGHREKTFSLLWQILHKFQYPRFERAAKVIQRWWLHPSLKTVLTRRICIKRRTAAAVVLQKHVRGHLCRRNLEALKIKLRAERNFQSKAKIIQRCFRRYLLKKNLARIASIKRQNDAATLIQLKVKVFLRKKRLKVEAATKIQSFFRAAMTRKSYKLKRSSAILIQSYVRVLLAKRELIRRREVRSAVRIQTCWRSFQARRMLRKIKATVQIQRAWRCYAARQILASLRQENELKRNNSAAVIQRALRCYNARKVLVWLRQENELKRNKAAVTIQCVWKCYVAKLKLMELKRQHRSAVTIQCAWKCFVARQILSAMHQENELKRNKAAVKIQCIWKCYVAKLKLMELKKQHSSATIIQCAWKCHVAKLKLMELKRQYFSAITIQCAWKCHVARLKLLELRKQHSSATIIQCAWKCHVARLKLLELRKQHSSATIIQCAWKCHIAKLKLMELKKQHSSATIIQCAWKCHVARLKLMELKRQYLSAITIQCAWKCHVARLKLLELRKQHYSAITIQCAWKCHVAKLKLIELKRQYLSAITIQCAWKCHIARLKLMELRKQHLSAITIQCAWKCHVARLKLVELKRQYLSAMTIQCAWKCHVAKRTLQELKRQHNAVSTVQRAWKCYKAREVLASLKRACELKRSNSAATIQRAWKCHASRQILASLRQEYELKRNNSAATIQQSWKCYKARQLLSSLKQEYELKRNNSAATIQRSWKCYKAGQLLSSLKQEYELKRNNSAATIQRAWRCHASKQILALLRQEYELKRSYSAAIIQRSWKCHKARQLLSFLKQEYELKRNNSAVTIQQAWKCHVARHTLANLKHQHNAVKMIQQAWKCFAAKRILHQLQQEYKLKLNNSASTIQHAWKCHKARQLLSSLQQECQLKRNEAAITIQCAWKSFVARKVLSVLKAEDLCKKNNAVSTIQQAWKCHVARLQLVELKKRHSSAIRIQCAWKCHVARLQLVELKKRHSSAIRIQCAWKCHVARLQLVELKKHHSSAIRIQCAWKCYVARLQLVELKKHHSSAIRIQCAWRCHVARLQLVELKKYHYSAIKIQCAWKCHLAKCALTTLKRQYNAASTIQRCWRCCTARQILSSLKHQQALKQNNSAAVIQRAWRCHVARSQLRQRKASITIQKTWRAFKARQLITKMKQDSAQRQRELSTAATLIQRALRNTWKKRAMTSLKSLRSSGVVDEAILLSWETHLLNYSSERDANLLIHILRQQKSSIDQRETAARIIQRMWRKYWIRSTKAATMIQALWRGYVCRRNNRQAAESKQAVVISVGPTETLVIGPQQVAQVVQRHERIQEVTRNVTSDQKIANKIKAAHAALGKTCAHDIYAMNIFNYYLTVSETCVPMILPSLDYILGLMRVNNRSIPAMEIALPASGALLSLAKHPISQPVVWQHPELITALQVVLVASRDGKGFNEMTFNNVSTVLWMLARDPAKKEELKNFPGFIFKLQATVKFVKGKERHTPATTKGGKKPPVPTLRFNKEPRSFASRIHGLHCLLKRLDIKCV